eukprot:gnl/Chilomastix_caulleri/1492.p1 GENE.gnl/Chilomastix_caulleri/1492~~gnl/Chilomastix_caulleri/1492.p1  ORF type:complete len:121 (+),score=9.67 gnl/Chilomastix_caulleri/1492:64-426(+)
MDIEPQREEYTSENYIENNCAQELSSSRRGLNGSKEMPLNFTDPTKLGPLEPKPMTPTSRKSLIYRTTAQDIGSLAPTEFEMPTEWHGRTFAFSRSLGDTNIQNQGMNTTLDRGRFIDIK